jgi:hypothetical protein
LALAKVTDKSYWVGVASHDHVLGAVQGGFCQLGHGKEALVRQLKAGDLIVFYSPRELMGSGPVLQAFTAAGTILDESPYVAEQSACFHPYCRRTKFFKSRQAPVRPLLQELTFTQGNENWGLAFRRGAFQITADDFNKIAKAMSIKSEDLSSTFAPSSRAIENGHSNLSS